ncbi:hypothetical protein Tco_0638325 [Tanacetum coccineum]
MMESSSTEENDQGDFLEQSTRMGVLDERLHQELTSPEANGFCEELASPGSNSSWLSIHLVVYNEELAIPEQTATGKGISNPLMAGSLPKTTKPT